MIFFFLCFSDENSNKLVSLFGQWSQWSTALLRVTKCQLVGWMVRNSILHWALVAWLVSMWPLPILKVLPSLPWQPLALYDDH